MKIEDLKELFTEGTYRQSVTPRAPDRANQEADSRLGTDNVTFNKV